MERPTETNTGLLARDQTTHERRLVLWFARLANIGNVRLRGFAKQSNYFRIRYIARRGLNQTTVLKLDLVKHGKRGKEIRGWPVRGRSGGTRPHARTQGGVPPEAPCVRDRPCRVGRLRTDRWAAGNTHNKQKQNKVGRLHCPTPGSRSEPQRARTGAGWRPGYSSGNVAAHRSANGTQARSDISLEDRAT